MLERARRPDAIGFPESFGKGYAAPRGFLAQGRKRNAADADITPAARRARVARMFSHGLRHRTGLTQHSTA